MKSKFRPVIESGMPKARVIPDQPDYMKPQFPEDSNESEKASSENRTPIVKQKYTEKFKRTKPSER
jgi:hypothetical protein